MRERGKAAAVLVDGYQDFNFAAASETPCGKHPNQLAVGVCAYCLKERLVRLACSQWGEQRLSSCSCSDGNSSFHRSSYCSAMEVGSVGRVSFLIENDKAADHPSKFRNRGKKPPEQVMFLRRRKGSGFRRIKCLFRRKRSKWGSHESGEFDADEVRSEIWVPPAMGISRSRSLCSFRDDDSSGFSSAKISDVTNGGVFLGELKPRKSGPHRSLIPARESDFRAMDDSAFIDLRVDLSEFCDSDRGGGGRGEAAVDQFGGVSGNIKSCGLSCKIAVDERGGGGGKGRKLWKWILKYHPANQSRGK